MNATSAFPLRMKDARLRALVREIAKREHLSQNELIEQAVANEVVIRGVLIAEELADAAARLAELSDRDRTSRIARSVEELAAGEGRRDPAQGRALRGPGLTGSAEPSPPVTDPFGVVAAFNAR